MKQTQMEEIRRLARERMADLRARKKKQRVCRRCKEPVELRADGEPMSACRTHLKEDAKRKRDARS